MTKLIAMALILIINGNIQSQSIIPTWNVKVYDHYNEGDEDSLFIGNSCSLGCAMAWDVTASSQLHSKNNMYSVNKLDDGYLNTAWVEGVNGYGIGETIIFHFPIKYFETAKIRDSINFDGFRIVNGYAKNKQTWLNNSRVKLLRLMHNGVAIVDVHLEDTMEIQETLNSFVLYIKPGDIVSAKIMDVYRGLKFKDTALTELIPLGAH